MNRATSPPSMELFILNQRVRDGTWVGDPDRGPEAEIVSLLIYCGKLRARDILWKKYFLGPGDSRQNHPPSGSAERRHAAPSQVP